jgi:Fic family protein
MLEKVLNNLDDYICKLVYSQSEKKILGFCLCLIVAPSDIESIVKLSDNQIPSALKHSDKIGIIKTVAVDKIGCIKPEFPHKL